IIWLSFAKIYSPSWISKTTHHDSVPTSLRGDLVSRRSSRPALALAWQRLLGLVAPLPDRIPHAIGQGEGKRRFRQPCGIVEAVLAPPRAEATRCHRRCTGKFSLSVRRMRLRRSRRRRTVRPTGYASALVRATKYR